MKYNNELHITVCCDDTTIEYFADVCRNIGVKSTVIDLLNGEYHVMTSSVINCTNDELTEEVNKVVSRLEKHFKIRRIKVETEPRNVLENKLYFLYYETHISCKEDRLDEIPGLLNDGWYKSRNVKKQGVIDITYRSNDPDLLIDIQFDVDYLNYKGITISGQEQMIVEYAIIDTNQLLDSKWIIKK